MTVSTFPAGDMNPSNPFDMGGRGAQLQQMPARSDQFERMGKWLELFMGTAEVAKVLARTAFVPEPMRGEPEAVAAAMMRALELGIDPLDGLSNLHVVKGKVGYSAEFMRRRIIEAGHEIEFDETTDDRCKMRGRRAGQEKWQTVTFTADNARKAKINLGDYPADKLVARASSRMCRRVFPDVLAGAAIIEDIIDGEIVEGGYEVPAEQQESGPARALQRKPRASRAKPEPTPADADEGQQPPNELDEFEPPKAAETPAPTEPEQTEIPAQPPADADPITAAQLQKLAILRQEQGFEDDEDGRADWFAWVSSVVGRQINSSNKEMTKDEASRLIDKIESAPEDPK